MHNDWVLHYARWVIEDGQPHREVGETFDWFALTFWTDEQLSVSSERRRSATPVADNRYRVVAEVTYLSERASILDFGLKATTTDDILSPGCSQGDFVTGEIYLNLPLCTEVGPDEVFKGLAYRWKVNRIFADLTPYVADPHDPHHYVRDVSRVRHEEVSSTDSVKANMYILQCSVIRSGTE